MTNAPKLKRQVGEYRRGRSRPLSLRLNSALWEDWSEWCRTRGWTPSAAIKTLMEQVLGGAKVKGWRSKRATRALRSADAHPLSSESLTVSEVTEEDLFTHSSMALDKMKGR